MIKSILLALCLLCYSQDYSQGFYEANKNYSLLNSGKKKVSIFKNGILTSFKTIDSTNRIITENIVDLTVILENKFAPKYNDKLSIRLTKKSFYNINGILDSVLVINYNSPLISKKKKGKVIVETGVVDSTLTIYVCKGLSNKIISSKHYLYKNGKKQYIDSKHYGYDNNDRLIIRIDGNGHSQFYYEYDKVGNISSYYVHKTKISFEYDELRRLTREIYINTTISYEYDNNSFVLKKISNGEDEYEETYVYE